MKRVINFRTFLFSAFFIMLGILSVYFQKTESVLGLIIFALAFILIGALFYIYKSDKTKIVGMIIVFALFLLSIVSFELAFVSHKSDYENPYTSIY